MLQDILSVGDKIDVRKLDHMGLPIKHQKTGVSQLIDFMDKNLINIAMPMVGSRINPMEIGAEYNLCFYTGKGLYQCNCRVITHFREKHVIATTVEITSAVEKFQRRQFYRLECMIDIEYRIITKEETLLETLLLADNFSSPQAKKECQDKLKDMDKDYYKGLIVDISGGGARFNSERLHQNGDIICIRMKINGLNTTKRYTLRTKVINSIKIMNKIGSYEHRVEFSDIDRNEREEIIRYIFEQERQRRQNDLSKNTQQD